MKKFTRRIENFVCKNCGYRVTGSGYTNHCPKCLYSKHVDVFPGDRQNLCKGLMKPVGFDLKKGIRHRCIVCRAEKFNRVEAADDHDIMLKLTSKMI